MLIADYRLCLSSGVPANCFCRHRSRRVRRTAAGSPGRIRAVLPQTQRAGRPARWFERLLAELQFELWIGDAAEIRTKRVRKQKTSALWSIPRNVRKAQLGALTRNLVELQHRNRCRRWQCGNGTLQDLGAEMPATCQASNYSDDPNHFKNERATRVDGWPEMHLQQRLEGQMQTKLQHPR
jgi:hypothetical protein